MKCPKCGYNSFEYLDTCKKCNNSLIAFKESLGLRPVILPAGAIIAHVAAGTVDTSGVSPAGHDNAGDDIFQWDMSSPASPSSPGNSGIDDFELNLGEESQTQTPQGSDPFSFDEDLTAIPPAQPASVAAQTFDEFSFDLPETQTADIFPHSAESSDQQVKQQSVDSIFGEFSFDEPAGSLQSGTAEPGAFTRDEQPTASGLPYDPFEEINEAEVQQEAFAQPTKTSGEFDLSRFLQLEDPADSVAPKVAGNPKLSGSEFDALFGEVESTDTKG